MKNWRLLAFLLRHSRSAVPLMIGAGVVSGLLSIAVLALINHALYQRGGMAAQLAAGFVLLVVGKIAAAAFSQLLLVRFSQGLILDLSLTLCTQMLRAPLRRLEREGPGQMLAVLTDDVSAVTWALQSLPKLATNVAVVIGCGIYLAWLSLPMFFWAGGVTLTGALIYKLIHDRTYKVMRAAREARARLLEHFRSLMSGLKELMLHRARREEFIQEELRGTAEEYRRTNLTATSRYVLAEAWVQSLLYALIGLLLFAYPAVTSVSVEALTGYVLAILYVMSPLWTIIGALPAVARGQIAFQKIEALGVTLQDSATASMPVAPAIKAGPHETSIEMRAAAFTYEPVAGADCPFTLGPVDFTLRSGELVFVVGGNGSGKSTFAKMLTGLYLPDRGVMFNSGVPVDKTNQEWHREHFSAVFADFHLFDKLFGIPSADLQAATDRYLRLLQIDGKVSLKGRAFSTLELSQGQRKRLALITAYLEDRPFYVFDEWAADQDPEYKEVFYSRLLPELRSRGKGVVVITHDDRYFHLGDRVLKLEDGKPSARTSSATRDTASQSASAV